MKCVHGLMRGLAACSLLSLLSGCGNQADAPPKGKATANAVGSNSTATSDTAAKSEEHDHDHGNGPNGGTITDWGGGAYHVEFTVDHEKKEATVYVLASDAKTPAPIKTEQIHLIINDPATEIDLVAQPLDGEAEGMSSRFVGTHDNIGTVKEFDGTISGEVEGTPYVGDFKELPGEHGHDH